MTLRRNLSYVFGLATIVWMCLWLLLGAVGGESTNWDVHLQAAFVIPAILYAVGGATSWLLSAAFRRKRRKDEAASVSPATASGEKSAQSRNTITA
jgi:membrane protein DedA with SNARE-associated domain